MEHIPLLPEFRRPADEVSASMPPAAAHAGARGPWAFVSREARLVWSFIRYDLSSRVVPMFLFLLAAARQSQVEGTALLAGLARGFVYFVLFVLTFCIANQMVGVEEDRVNKPDRPLVRGDVDLRGAEVRWWVSMGLFTLAGWSFGVLQWTLAWQVIIYLHNMRSWARHWFTKDLSMGLGVMCQLIPSWTLMAPLTPGAWRWAAALAVAIFFLVPVQDLRDMQGDRLSERLTLPLHIGEAATRAFLVTGFCLLPVGMHLWLFSSLVPGVATWACEAASALVSLVIAGRLLLLRTPRADHWSYLLFTLWFCIMLGSSLVLL